MDYMIDDPYKVSSHYEAHVDISMDVIHEVLYLKETVFQAMDRLEGWCSKEKASILIDLIVTLRPQTVVEIGVFGGKSLVPMAFALKYNKFGKVYGVDAWDAQVSVEHMDFVHASWWASIDHNAIYEELLKEIKAHQLENEVELLKCTSMDANIPESAIDLLHIDGNHSDKTSYEDVTKWVPLVCSGGIIILDDLDWPSTCRAKEYLDNNCQRIAEIKGAINTWGIWLK